MDCPQILQHRIIFRDLVSAKARQHGLPVDCGFTTERLQTASRRCVVLRMRREQPVAGGLILRANLRATQKSHNEKSDKHAGQFTVHVGTVIWISATRATSSRQATLSVTGNSFAPSLRRNLVAQVPFRPPRLELTRGHSCRYVTTLNSDVSL
jgi:hypothetical protein